MLEVQELGQMPDNLGQQGRTLRASSHACLSTQSLRQHGRGGDEHPPEYPKRPRPGSCLPERCHRTHADESKVNFGTHDVSGRRQENRTARLSNVEAGMASAD